MLLILDRTFSRHKDKTPTTYSLNHDYLLGYGLVDGMQFFRGDLIHPVVR